MGKRSGLFQVNLVSVVLVLIVVALAYGGWKFGPVYWQARKVDSALAGAKWEASKINLFEGDARLEALENRVRDECLALGIDDAYLEVYFSDDRRSLHADYQVDIHHIVGGKTTLKFRRVEEIPQPDLGD